MPYATISTNSRTSTLEARALSRELIRLLVEDLGKDPQLSVVRVVDQPAAFHLCNDSAPASLTAVEVHITSSTTTAEQRASFISHVQVALERRGLGSPPSYVIVHEHGADTWGYGGATQAMRQTGAATASR